MINILKDYPKKNKANLLKKSFRTFNNKIVSTYRDKRFFNGSRSEGYGGYKYDGRWLKVAKNCINSYNLQNNSNILHVNCEMGFLMHDLKLLNPSLNVYGTETSKYAIQNAKKNIKKNINFITPQNINFKKNFFDLTIAIGVVYALTLTDAIMFLKKIKYITKKNNTFITLASYNTKKDLEIFQKWSLLGNLILKKEDWKTLLNHCNYKGDYKFINADNLNLK